MVSVAPYPVARLRAPSPGAIGRSLALLGLMALGVGLLAYSTTPRGAGVETDSVNYLSAAGSLSQGNGYLGWDGQLLPYFPPGYPLAVALGKILTGAAATPVAQVADLIFFAALVLATYLLARCVVANRLLRLLLTSLVPLSPIVLRVYGVVSSETLFNLLCVVSLVLLCEIERKRRLGPIPYPAALGLLAVLAAIAALTRIAGVALVLSLAITLMVVASPRRRILARVLEGAVFSVVAMAPIIAWDVFVHSQSGSWTFGDRPPSTVGITTNTLTAVHTVAGWISGPSVLFPGAGWLDLVVVTIVLAALVTGLVRRGRIPTARLRGVAPVLVFCVVYPAFLIAVSSRVDLIGALDDRYLSPLFAPLAVLLGFVIDLTWTGARRAGKPAIAMAVAVGSVLVLSVVFSSISSGRYAQYHHDQGISGVTSAVWSEMSLLRAARALPARDGGALISNVPEMMSYSTGRLYQYSPFRVGGEPKDLLQQVRSYGPAYLVLVSSDENPELYTPDELAQWFTVRVLASSADGQLVELSQLK